MTSPVTSSNDADATKTANPPSAPAPVGRVDVQGVILSTKHVPNDFGGSWKMLVELPTRARVWCAIPTGCQGKVGEQVHFVATFERSDKDPYFSFGSRPKLYVEKPAKAKKSRPASEPPPAAAAEVPAELTF